MQAQTVDQCPFRAVVDAPRAQGHDPDRADDVLRLNDVLVLPLNRRMVVQYFDDPDAGRVLRLFHGDKEVSFDEPELFAFGESLATQARFTAGSATAWGPSYAWAKVQPLLQQLIDEGVLQRAGDVAEVGEMLHVGEQPSPLPVSACTQAHDWRDAERILQTLTGRPLEHGWLELVVPVFRVAHMALDAEGRQVGESNVFPPALRLNVPTRWRACIYPGTRYQVDRPMNVTALKTMRAHWNPMMLVLQAVRAAYLRRFAHDASLQGGARWTVGHLERLATAVLAVATYPLVRADQPVANGGLHPVLSSVFRVTDGLRMTMHQMLFVPVGEPTLAPDAPMTSTEILAYAERNYSFHSEHGVCAGPQAMVEEFLAVLVDGQPVTVEEPLPDELHAVLDKLSPAIDYGLLGLQAYAAVFSLWPLMTRAYERLNTAAQAWADAAGGDVATLAAHLAVRVAALRTSTYLAHEQWRVDRQAVYADMHAQCALGTGQRAAEPLPRQLATDPTQVGATAMHLMALLSPRLGHASAAASQAMGVFVQEVASFLHQELALLRAAARCQWAINQVLARAHARRPFGAKDIDLHNQLQGTARRVPDLVADLESLLNLQIDLDIDGLRLSPHTQGVSA